MFVSWWHFPSYKLIHVSEETEYYVSVPKLHKVCLKSKTLKIYLVPEYNC